MRVYVYTMTVDRGFAPNPYGGLCTLACCKGGRSGGVRRSVGKCIVEAFKNDLKESTGGEDICESMKSECPRTAAEIELSKEGDITLDVVKQCFDTDEVFKGKEIFRHKQDFESFVRNLGIYVIGIAGKGKSGLQQEAVKRGYLPETDPDGLVSGNLIVYMMQVTDVVTFHEYWRSYSGKRPTDTHAFGLKADAEGNQVGINRFCEDRCGDNVYEVNVRENGAEVVAHPSFHFHGISSEDRERANELLSSKDLGSIGRYTGESLEAIVSGLNEIKENSSISRSKPLKEHFENVIRDISGKYVLISNSFVYFGNNTHENAGNNWFVYENSHYVQLAGRSPDAPVIGNKMLWKGPGSRQYDSGGDFPEGLKDYIERWVKPGEGVVLGDPISYEND